VTRIRLDDVSRYFDVSSGRTKESRTAAMAREQREARSERVIERGKVAALDHMSLEIPDGQTFAVVGPSGCGKTTLLRVVAGLDLDYSGRVYYDDTLMERIPPQERMIGMVFQNFALYPQWEGEGNLRFFFRVHHVEDAETRERIRVTSEIMGIGFEELLGRMPRTLSAGQKQRVAIGRAIVRSPRLFLFDEPLSNLDAELRARSRLEIRRLLTRFGITAIYVTHDQREAVMIGNRIVVMRDGKVEQTGVYTDLAQKPANTFVASFLGPVPMSLFAGGTVDGEMLRFDELALPLPGAIRALVTEGEVLTAGVRPEAARLGSTAGLQPGGIRIRGKVELIEPDYARKEQSVQLRTGRFTYFAACSQDLPLHLKEEVEIVFPADAFVFFDDRTGRRIG
jgi:ABC-type sugar transport system ATPase subunit